MNGPTSRPDPQPPWPELGLTAFQAGSNPSTTAYLKWYGMGTTEGYAQGFKKAIERIVTTLHDGGRQGHPDQLLYPVAFLARHLFELTMKHLIVQGSNLIPPRVTVEDLSRTHSLEELWARLRPTLERLWPSGPRADLDAVESVLLEFHQFDPNGQAFRYDTDRKGSRHLAGLPEVVDLENLWETVRDVVSLFEACSAAIQDIIENTEQH